MIKYFLPVIYLWCWPLCVCKALGQSQQGDGFCPEMIWNHIYCLRHQIIIAWTAIAFTLAKRFTKSRDWTGRAIDGSVTCGCLAIRFASGIGLFPHQFCLRARGSHGKAEEIYCCALCYVNVAANRAMQMHWRYLLMFYKAVGWIPLCVFIQFGLLTAIYRAKVFVLLRPDCLQRRNAHGADCGSKRREQRHNAGEA